MQEGQWLRRLFWIHIQTIQCKQFANEIHLRQRLMEREFCESAYTWQQMLQTIYYT